jgi:prepilin-type N-terminal cleavage/methylation domain-containing protein
MNNQFLRTSVRSLPEIDTERTCYTRTLKSAVLWQRMYRGLTLIECLISLLLLTILLVGGMAFYFYAHQSLRWSINKEIATGIANCEMEDIKNSGYNNLPNPALNSCLDDPNRAKNNVIVGNLPATAQERVSVCGRNDGTMDYKEVQVSITWQQPNKTSPETVSLVTDIAP